MTLHFQLTGAHILPPRGGYVVDVVLAWEMLRNRRWLRRGPYLVVNFSNHVGAVEMASSLYGEAIFILKASMAGRCGLFSLLLDMPRHLNELSMAKIEGAVN